MKIEWALNQKMEAIVGADQIAFYARGAGNEPMEAGTLVFSNLSSAVREHAMRDGLKKRVNDGCANKKNVADVIATVQRFCDHYNSGTEEWNLRTAGPIAIDRKALFAAIAQVRERSEDAVYARLNNMDDGVLRQLLTDANIAAEYVRRTHKGTSDSATIDNLLDSL